MRVIGNDKLILLNLFKSVDIIYVKREEYFIYAIIF